MKTLEQLGISPAPWTKRGDCSVYGEILAADNTSVVEYDWSSIPAAEVADEPNARLIAAAPELYEALRLCVGEMCKFCKDTEIGKRLPCENGCEVFRMARAALEKAGGAE